MEDERVGAARERERFRLKGIVVELMVLVTKLVRVDSSYLIKVALEIEFLFRPCGDSLAGSLQDRKQGIEVHIPRRQRINSLLRRYLSA